MRPLAFWRYITVAILVAVVGFAILGQIVRIQASPEVAGVNRAGHIYSENLLPCARGNLRPKWQPIGRQQDGL